MRTWIRRTLFAVVLPALILSFALADEPDTDHRMTQEMIESGRMTIDEIRMAGLKMFSTSFTTPMGFGDGPINPADTILPGGRPTLQGNGMLLRINGLDGQSCVECHSVISAATVPPTFGVGGVGGSVSNAIIMPTEIDPTDTDLDGTAGFTGRFANPPFIFGAGGVELLGLEMTEDLQALRAEAVANPGTTVELWSKGVHFGSITADAQGNVDTTSVVGVDPDLVVEPFGRKGEFATTREFDIEAMMFHFGMQPTERVGRVDEDGDGIYDEIIVGELSSLSILLTTSERPRMAKLSDKAERGFEVFTEIGCASCHRPTLSTRSTQLLHRFPEERTDPTANAYLAVDLTRSARFEMNRDGGVDVPLFADLKRHDMGPGLAETFQGATDKFNREFTTARLWGVADTAPYLHDGRASTLTEAILLHGGEAQEARDAFANLGGGDTQRLLEFLKSLRTPREPMKQLINRVRNGNQRLQFDDEVEQDRDAPANGLTELSK